MQTNDEAELAVVLEASSPWQRAAFAVACAQRLSGLYFKYVEVTGEGESEFFRHTLASLWEALEEERDPGADWQGLAEKAEGLVPPGDAVNVTVWHWFAMDAMAALVYAIQVQVDGNVEKAVWAARQASEAVMFYVRQRDHLEIRTEADQDSPERCPELQEELTRQRRDIDLLSGGAPRKITLHRLRERAEQARLFDAETVH